MLWKIADGEDVGSEEEFEQCTSGPFRFELVELVGPPVRVNSGLCPMFIDGVVCESAPYKLMFPAPSDSITIPKNRVSDAASPNPFVSVV